MITICQITQVKYGNYDEVWAIVRSLKYSNPRIRQVPELSPSWELFKQYKSLCNNGKWNEETFRKIYVPQFLREMCGQEQQKLLNELFNTKKHICLVCFCPEEELCHRSIIGGMLQGAGLDVKGLSRDYSFYYTWWKQCAASMGGKEDTSASQSVEEKIKRIIDVNPNTTYLYTLDLTKVKLFLEDLLTMFFTGRRPKDLCWYDASKYTAFVNDLAKLLYEEFYVKRGVRRFISGAAQGFDQMAFWAVHQLKTKYGCEDVQNVVFVAFEQQEARWAKTGCFSQDEYWKMIKMADKIVVVKDNNNIDSLFDRNHAMCDYSQFGLGLYPDDSWRTNKGGTSECLRYAANSSAEMFRLGYTIYADRGLQMCQMATL